MKTFFRLALVLDILAFAALFLFAFIAPAETNEEILRRTHVALYDSIDPFFHSLSSSLRLLFTVILFGFAGLVVVAAVLTYIGLFRFWNWARFANLYWCIISLILTPFLGWSILSPPEAAVLELSRLLGGAILAASFLPPLSEYFSKTKVEQGA